MSDLPKNSEFLDHEGQKLFLVVLEADGTSTRTEITDEGALAFLDRSIGLYGLANLTEGGIRPDEGTVSDRALPPSEVAEILRRLIDRVTQEAATPEAALVAIRAAITSPLSIQGLVLTDIPRERLLELWPNLDAILGWTPGDESGNVQFPTSLAQATGTQAVPPPQGPTSASMAGGGISAGDSARVGDPVLAFSGQLLIEQVDLEMAGIGLDIRLARTYLHNTGYSGPLGPHWDHSYNLWIREEFEQLADGRWELAVYRSTGRLSADRFVGATYDDLIDPSAVPDAVFWASDGTFDRLEKTAGRYRFTTPDGLRVDYGDHQRAVALQDRNGNRVRLEWSDDPPRLSRLIDTCGRVLWFDHDDAGRLVGVRDDSIGRELRYQFDGDGRLERVHRTLSSERGPELVHAYRYWAAEAPPGLEANIVAIADARRREVLQIDYGDELGLLGYNRVIEQRDGGVTRYSYGFVAEADPDEVDDEFGRAAIRVEMTLPDHNVHILDYNARGRLVRLEAEASDLAGVRRVVSRWSYTPDGLIRRERHPDGSSVEYRYGRDVFESAGGDVQTASPQERARFAQLRRIVERPRPGVGGPPLRVTEFDYHPALGLITERRGPYYADALGDRIDDGPSFSARVDYDAQGNALVVHHPDCERPDGSLQTGLDAAFSYDLAGRMVRTSILLEDGTTVASERRYPPIGDPTAAHPAALISDADGLALERTLLHDRAGRMIRSEEPSGLVEVRSVDHAGRLLRVEESGPGVAPRLVETEWAAQDVPRRVRRTRAGADGVAQPWAEMIEEFGFDPEGDIVSSRVRSADGTIDRAVRIEYGPERRVRRIVQDGVVIEHDYDARGLIVRREVRTPEMASRVSHFLYDDAGRLVRQVDPAGDAEDLRYDGFGRVSRRIGANGSVAVYTWDAGDRLLSHRVVGVHPDLAGPATLFEERRAYDSCGRLAREEVAVFDPARPTTGPGWTGREYTYDRADRVIEILGPGSTRQQFAYDGLGRLTRVDDGLGTLAETVFDDVLGRVEHEVTVSGSGADGPVAMTFTSSATLDARGASIHSVDGLGNGVSREYDSDGNLTATIDAAGLRNESLLAPDGVVTSFRLAANTPAELGWSMQRDARGLTRAVDGPRGRVVDLDFDPLAQLTALRLPGGVEVTYTMDAAGRLVEAREASGIRVRFDYGTGGRLERRRVDVSARAPGTARDTLAPTEIAYHYDGLDQMVLADDSITPVERRFDSRGGLLSERTGTRTVAWEYGVDGAATSFTYSDGWRAQFERDASNRIRRVLGPAGGGTEEVARVWPLGLGLILDAEWRGAVRSRQRRDGAGRFVALDVRRVPDGTSIVRVGQLADRRGLPAVRFLILPGRQRLEIFGVDELGRITSVRSGDLGAAPPDLSALDAGGSATQLDVDAAVTALEAGAAALPFDQVVLDLDPDGARRRLTATPGPGGLPAVTTYDVSPAGLAVPIGEVRFDDVDGLPRLAAGAQLEYDGWRRVSAATTPGASAVVLRDSLGRPVRVRGPAGDVEIVHDGQRLVEVHRVAGASVRFIRLPGSSLLLEVQDGASRAHPVADPDGTTLVLLDETGSVLARSGFDAFGRRAVSQGTWPPLAEAFHGMPPLTDRLFLSPTRIYDAATGSYLEQDEVPLADGPNLHMFARGNPTAFTDPLGLMAQASGATGADGAPDGVKSGLGTYRADPWVMHAAQAYIGMVSAVVAGVTEPLKQLYDLVGMYTEVYLELGYQHRLVSGLGQMGESGMGTLDMAKAMGVGIVSSPIRLWDAAQRQDYSTLGAEVVNNYMLLKPVAAVGVNRAIGALQARRPGGFAALNAIRGWQVRRLGAQANKILGLNDDVIWSYSRSRAKYGDFDPATRVVRVYELAFTPGLKEFYTVPSEVGGVVGSSGSFARWSWSIENALRGTSALRTAVHERWHGQQYVLLPAPGRLAQVERPLNPLEWTLRATDADFQPFAGAHNAEMRVPFGSGRWWMLGVLGEGQTSFTKEQ